MAGQTLHDVRAEAFNYVWDNSIAPAVEVESGDDVELHVRDAGDEQITKESGTDDSLVGNPTVDGGPCS